MHNHMVSQKSTPLRLAYILACGHPLQMKIYPVVCHSYSHLFTNFGPHTSVFVRIATIFVSTT